jgi:hypothetical protein
MGPRAPSHLGGRRSEGAREAKGDSQAEFRAVHSCKGLCQPVQPPWQQVNAAMHAQPATVQMRDAVGSTCVVDW